VGSVNHGSQDLSYNFYEELTALNFNERNINIQPRGIYKGGYLTKVTDSEVTLSPLTVEIGDSTVQVAISTSVSATLNNTTLDSGTISSGTPYLVLRWAYAATASNYFEVHAVAAVAAAQANDIIIGKCVFSGAVLTGFDYTDRTSIGTYGSFLKVEATPDTELYVRVRGGRVQLGDSVKIVADQKVGPFSVPAPPNSRWDLVYLDTNGVPQIYKGAQAVSPTVPPHAGKLVLAQILVVNGVSDIAAANIYDFRTCISAPAIPDNSSLELNSLGQLAVKDFASAIASDGYIRFGGLIFQWGVESVAQGTTVNVTLPITFPNNHFWASARPGINTGFIGCNENASTGALPLSVSQIQLRNGYGAGGGNRDMYWFAIGN